MTDPSADPNQLADSAAASPLTSRDELEGQVPTATSATELREIVPGDPSVWLPQSFSEWEAQARTRAFLAAWTDQVAHERTLRSLAAKIIFGLIGVQVVGVFAIVALQGLGTLTINEGVLQVLIPSVLADVFGLGFVVTKYLFSQPLRHGFDALVRGKRVQDGT